MCVMYLLDTGVGTVGTGVGTVGTGVGTVGTGVVGSVGTVNPLPIAPGPPTVLAVTKTVYC